LTDLRKYLSPRGIAKSTELIIEILQRCNDQNLAKAFIQDMITNKDEFYDTMSDITGEAVGTAYFYDIFDNCCNVLGKRMKEDCVNPLFYMYLNCFVKARDIDIVSYTGQSMMIEDMLLNSHYGGAFGKVVDQISKQVRKYDGLKPKETNWSTYHGFCNDREAMFDFYESDDTCAGVMIIKNNSLGQIIRLFGDSFAYSHGYYYSYTFRSYGGEYMVDISEFAGSAQLLLSKLRQCTKVKRRIDYSRLARILDDASDHSGWSSGLIPQLRDTLMTESQVLL
jgi:uncharacterized protein (DUF2237 family)